VAETGLADVCTPIPILGLDQSRVLMSEWMGCEFETIIYIEEIFRLHPPPETAPRKDCEIGHNYEPPRLGGLVLLICGDLLSNILEDDLL
jgi:hypothetical protein